MADWTAPMEWGGTCTEPSDTLKESGYSGGDNPCAEHENFFRNRTAACITELQAEVDTLQAFIDSLDKSMLVVRTESVGDNVTATLYMSGRLTITGTGTTTAALSDDFSKAVISIWSDLSTADVTPPNIEIEEGVTSLCANFFSYIAGCWAIGSFKSIGETEIPASVTSIGYHALCTPYTIYAGTMEQWRAIEMPTDASIYYSLLATSEDHYVQCTDGILQYVSMNDWEEVTDD